MRINTDGKNLAQVVSELSQDKREENSFGVKVAHSRQNSLFPFLKPTGITEYASPQNFCEIRGILLNDFGAMQLQQVNTSNLRNYTQFKFFSPSYNESRETQDLSYWYVRISPKLEFSGQNH